jgi:hypothetical protein
MDNLILGATSRLLSHFLKNRPVLPRYVCARFRRTWFSPIFRSEGLREASGGS